MKRIHFLVTLIISLLAATGGQAQGLTREQVNDSILPHFSIYKDNYFITGVPLHTDVSKQTADVKYQISFKQLLTRNTLPFNSYLFLTYSQKAFWAIYDASYPFEEINFNPAVGLGIPLFNDEDRLKGIGEIQLEHESNGRDSIYSRSWNNFSLGYHTSISNDMILSMRAWLPFRYKGDNPDLMQYIGYGELNLEYDIKPDVWILDINLRKGFNFDLKGALRTRLFYRIAKRTNQYIMLEWYNGHAESLIDFEEFRSMIRVGYVIKSVDLNLLKGRSR